MDNQSLAILVGITLLGALVIATILARDTGLGPDLLGHFPSLASTAGVARTY